MSIAASVELGCTTVPPAAYYAIMLVKGKKALVFGGTSGIGLAAAIMLRDEGCEVVAISRDPSAAAITTDGVTGIATAANDVRAPRCVVAAVAVVVDALGGCRCWISLRCRSCSKRRRLLTF